MIYTFSLLAQNSAKQTNVQSEEKEEIVATVNGKPITKSYFEKIYNQNLLFVNDAKVTKEKILNDIINRELGIQRAKKADLEKNEIVQEKLEDVLYHAQVSKDLEETLKKIPPITDSEVSKYYAENPEYRTAQILLRVRALPTDDEEKAAMQKAIELHKSLVKEPNSFAEMANKYTQANTAPTGGDLGFQPAIRQAPEVLEAIKGKKIGHITPPVRSQFGYHLIKILDIKKEKEIEKELYKKILYDVKRDKILANYFADMRKNAKVTIDKNLLK
jgi:peptidyl-prolyl cis-trans isomerase C